MSTVFSGIIKRKRTRKGIKAVERKPNLPELPEEIIYNIVALLPVVDAARTSMLSRSWRYRWTETPNLILDRQFSERLSLKYGSTFQDEYIAIVDSLLFQHPRPCIQKFVLEIPQLPTTHFSIITDDWLLTLATNGLRELNLDNSANVAGRYLTIHTCFFSEFPELTRATLTNCCFRTPLKTQGSCNLTHLTLNQVTFLPPSWPSDGRFIHAPQLAVLDLRDCKGLHCLRLRAPSLRKLILFRNWQLDLSYFIRCKNLTDVRITTRLAGIQRLRHGIYGSINLTKLIRSWPKLTQLHLDATTRKHLGADSDGIRPRRFPIRIQRLKQSSS
ncbi:F-box/FBD/LRR-repeat protein At1g13570-like isoform X1 [Coffea arabica]|uniref:F-box/FBD/LRR-repeat protein At1g13570-like isoform X1 n=1 Tax=Coffea arabica TaxID=13443 RepID=A0ABM4U726_COFAR